MNISLKQEDTKILTDGRKRILTIQNAYLEDAGNYNCHLKFSNRWQSQSSWYENYNECYFKKIMLVAFKVQMLKVFNILQLFFQNLLLNLSQSLKTLKYLKEKRLNLSALYQRKALKSSGREMIRLLNLEINMMSSRWQKEGSSCERRHITRYGHLCSHG